VALTQVLGNRIIGDLGGFLAGHWWIVAIVVLAIIALVRQRLSPSGQALKDSVRLFTAAQRAEGFARAGGRCEFDGLMLWNRCSGTAAHGDHFYPWSRGGATTMTNQVAACVRCNLSKSDHIPTASLQRRIERRRRGYFPSGTPATAGQWFGRPAGVR
jgi:hypothetical protein